ncbi:MAG: ABC transporter permease [Rhodoglobus sp.]
MSATTLARPASSNRLSSAGILRSEWIKLRTVRATVWSYAIVILVSIGLAALMSSTINLQNMGPIPPEAHAQIVLDASTVGVSFGQLVVSVLGVLVITGEYSTGMIRSTLTAVPRRLPALWAKGVVLFLATLVVGLVSVFSAYAVAAPILAAKGIESDIARDGVLLALVGGALYLALVAVFALAIGTMLRNSAGGIAAVLGTVLILPSLVLIPARWVQDVSPYLLSNAGRSLFSLPSSGAPFEPWQALLVVMAWVAASLAAAAVLLKRRDA